MARKPRVHFPGALYHVMSRGNHGQRIFHDDEDRTRYLQFLNAVPRRFGCRLFAFVLMDNHVHLLIEVDSLPLSKIMQHLQFRYTQWYNRRYRTLGHLFQGRYKAILCEQDAYLLQLVRYIHVNPIRARLTPRLDRYRWSSHRLYVTGDETQGVAVDAVLSQFGRTRRAAIYQYRQFIRDGLTEGHRDDLYQVVDQRFLGDEAFIQEIRRRVDEPEAAQPLAIGLKELVHAISTDFGTSAQRVRQRDKSRAVSRVRWVVGKFAIEQAGYSLVTVARYLHRDPGVLSRGLRQLDERLEMDRPLQRRIRNLQIRIREGQKVQIAKRQA